MGPQHAGLGRQSTLAKLCVATLLSRVCALLDVDPVRDWNVDQPDTWGALGHFSIASRTQLALSGDFPKLGTLMKNNLEIISHKEDALRAGEFSGMGTDRIRAHGGRAGFFLEDRVAKQGFDRYYEGGNHFADMDQKGADGKTLLELTEDDSFIDPDKWEEYYNGITDILSGKPVAENRRGLLPFRVWQIFDAMCEFASEGKAAEFVCAAGVLTHYCGDACQPLHISYLHDGDPNRPVKHTFTKGKKAGQSEKRPEGQGIHSAYEDKMVFDHRDLILDGLKKTPEVKEEERITTGFDAAKLTIELMRNTFDLLPPPKMVDCYIRVGKGGAAASKALWNSFGAGTIKVMQDGTHHRRPVGERVERWQRREQCSTDLGSYAERGHGYRQARGLFALEEHWHDRQGPKEIAPGGSNRARGRAQRRTARTG